MSRSVTISLPKYHDAQREIVESRKRFNVVACGRRFGKTKMLTRQQCETALRGERYGYFAPSYKILLEVYDEVSKKLAPVAKCNKSEKRISTINGGLIEFWSLDDEDAGRSRKYHRVGIDEAGLVKDLEKRWNEAIRPTLTDYRGSADFVGTPKGAGFFRTGFALGQDPLNHEWASWQMPTVRNTTIEDLELEIEAARLGMPDRAFRQEYLAEFLEDAGGVFRGVDEVVVKGKQYGKPVGQLHIGLDLAKVEDFTVICVVDDQGQQCYFERFNQISWEVQFARILELHKRMPKALWWVDSTGVGSPVYDRMIANAIPTMPYGITNASKNDLIDNLSMRIEAKSVELLDVPVQTNELKIYQYELTKSRNVTMNAPAGMHDDCVIALALGVWGSTKVKPVSQSNRVKQQTSV